MRIRLSRIYDGGKGIRRVQYMYVYILMFVPGDLRCNEETNQTETPF